MQAMQIGHVGCAVASVERSVDFYVGAFGARVLFGPTDWIKPGSGHIPRLCQDKFGSEFSGLRLAMLKIGETQGLEIFEFESPDRQGPHYGSFMKSTGSFLTVINCPGLEAMNETLARVIQFGGASRSQIWRLWPDRPWHIVYCTDPDGHVLELTSHSFLEMWGEGG